MIIIEGLTGSGKSYVCNMLSVKYPNLTINQERVDDDWRRSKLYDINMLDMKYNNDELSNIAQLYILMSFQVVQNVNIVERSIYSAYYIFSKLPNPTTLKQQVLNECYHKFFNNVIDNNMPEHEIIFLDVDPEICLRNIKNRGRVEESSITLEDLESLRTKYLEMLNQAKCKVICVTNTDDCIRIVEQRLNEQSSRHIRNQTYSSN